MADKDDDLTIEYIPFSSLRHDEIKRCGKIITTTLSALTVPEAYFLVCNLLHEIESKYGIVDSAVIDAPPQSN